MIPGVQMLLEKETRCYRAEHSTRSNRLRNAVRKAFDVSKDLACAKLVQTDGDQNVLIAQVRGSTMHATGAQGRNPDPLEKR